MPPATPRPCALTDSNSHSENQPQRKQSRAPDLPCPAPSRAGGPGHTLFRYFVSAGAKSQAGLPGAGATPLRLRSQSTALQGGKKHCLEAVAGPGPSAQCPMICSFSRSGVGHSGPGLRGVCSPGRHLGPAGPGSLREARRAHVPPRERVRTPQNLLGPEGAPGRQKCVP